MSEPAAGEGQAPEGGTPPEAAPQTPPNGNETPPEERRTANTKK